MNNQPQFHGLGAAFYPEHHPRKTWPKYVKQLKDAGFGFVRMGEFAWDKIEPEEGRFAFEWLDEVFGLLNEQRIKVILCTPTATPPLWACEKYPGIHPVLSDGKVFGFGTRRYVCPTSPDYLRLSRNVVTAMAKQYGRRSQVLAWQLDNEVGHPFCFCGHCLERFQDWCKKRYGTIQRFNDALCTHFWGQTLDRFSQISFPNTYQHPGLWLIYQQFYSDQVIACYGQQADILREQGARAPITTNMMLTWYGYDHEKMARKLDVIAGDHYGFGDDPLFGKNFLTEAFVNAYMRGMKNGQNVWFTEFQCGRAGNAPLPGQVRWEALTQIGLGADLFSFFRFDTSPSGGERDEYGLLGVSQKQGRIYGEIKRLGGELNKIRKEVNGSTPPKADVAVLFTHDNHSEFARTPKFSEFEGVAGNGYSMHLARHYQSLTRLNIPCDIVYPGSDLAGYKVIIAPALYILPRALADKLEQFAARGGVLVMTSFSGIADENARVWDVPAPANLTKVLGIEVLDYAKRSAAAGPVRIKMDRKDFSFSPLMDVSWLDEISPVSRGVDVLGRYDNPFFQNVPAITRNRYKKGWGYYLGGILPVEGYHRFYETLAREIKLKPLLELPQGVFVTMRRKGNRKLFFISNPHTESREVDLTGAYRDLVSGERIGPRLTLKPFDVRVLSPLSR